MQVRVTTNRRVWLNDAPRDKGDIVDVTDEEASILFQRGFAEPVNVVTEADVQAAHAAPAAADAGAGAGADDDEAPQAARRRRGV